MAAKSPVKLRLMSVIGTTWAYPPPAAPPFIPNTGPIDGSRSATIAFSPSEERASARPTEVVVLPSPAGVGEIAVTRTRRPSGRSARLLTYSREILALVWPYGTSAAGSMPRVSRARSTMGVSSAASAMSMSAGTGCVFVVVVTRPIVASPWSADKGRGRTPRNRLRDAQHRRDPRPESGAQVAAGATIRAPDAGWGRRRGGWRATA